MRLVTQALVNSAFNKFQISGCRPPSDPPADPKKREAYFADMAEVWLMVLDGVSQDAFTAAVAAHLMDAEACRWWPRPAEIRQRALAMDATPLERAVSSLDPDGAYAVAREYYKARGPYWWPGGPHLRDARRQRNATVDVVVARIAERCGAATRPVTVNAATLAVLEEGRRAPHSWELHDIVAVLAEFGGAESLATELDQSEHWYDLAYSAPLVAEAARRAAPWASWADLGNDGLPSHRKAFRDCYAALVADQHSLAGEAAARRVVEGKGGKLRSLSGVTEVAVPNRLAPPAERPRIARPKLPEWAQESAPRRLEVADDLGQVLELKPPEVVFASVARGLSMDRGPVSSRGTGARASTDSEERRRRLEAAFELERQQREARSSAGGGERG